MSEKEKNVRATLMLEKIALAPKGPFITHLDYYREHGISPVRYSGTKEQHFQRRASLYRSLRLPPLAFRGSRVLEVAAGTGQNAEYLASLNPAYLEIVEPNYTEALREVLTRTKIDSCTVTTLEEMSEREPFDIVICENWLGLPEVEAGLLDKLAAMVAPDGVLVLTCVHPQGFYPNQLRRKIAARLINDSMSFEEKTATLVQAFETHLATLKAMTRSHRDWVQDQLLNPAVENILLTFPMLIEKLGKDFTILGTSPEFYQEYRWFKELHGEQRQFNKFAGYDYDSYKSFFADYRGNARAFTDQSIAEAKALLARDAISVDDVRNMGPFRSLFGRETIFCSWSRNA